MYQEVHDWPNKVMRFGQIAAVTLDNNKNVVIFHRADHVWNERYVNFIYLMNVEYYSNVSFNIRLLKYFYNS